MQQRGGSHTAGTASGPLACQYGRCQARVDHRYHIDGNFVGGNLAAAVSDKY